MAFFDKFEHLKIQLDEIKSATDNFSDNNVIGVGGFGKVYKGEISHSKGRSLAAFKRLDEKLGQGNCEFWKEITMLSHYTHENLVSLVGYCDDGGEKILVYEHASRGSLDHHLSSTALTWTQRLRICLGVARGICYLHDPMGTQQRVIHRDIKSSNILLDENWNAKVSDMGLSKIGHANQQYTVMVSNAVGTLGYVDPLYLEKGMLTKESDVYSFGVVLFEVLCGRLCYEYSNRQYQIFVPLWKQSYEEKKIDDIIFQALKQQMNLTSLETYLDIAYECLLKSREERPSMARVVEKLETALRFQEMEVPKEYEAVLKSVAIPVDFKSIEELKRLLTKGVLTNTGKTWLSLNKNEEHCELISARECLKPNANEYITGDNSRFAKCCYKTTDMRFGVDVRARFLSPGIKYTVNLVLNYLSGSKGPAAAAVKLDYKIEGETESSVTYTAYKSESGCMNLELYQFTSEGTSFDLDIRFEGMEFPRKSYGPKIIIVEGIEFRPLKKVEHEAVEDEEEDMQPASDSDLDWEQKLPNDYKQIIKRSKDTITCTTKKELYYHFRRGFLINSQKGFLFNRGEEWVSLSTNGKICRMLPARATLVTYQWKWKSLPTSRFKQVATGSALFNRAGLNFGIICKINSKILSPQTTYACYLVYQITNNHYGFLTPLLVRVMEHSSSTTKDHIYLRSPQTRVITTKDEYTYNQSDLPKFISLPRERKNDGWMEVQVWKFKTGITSKNISRDMYLVTYPPHVSDMADNIIVQGIEFRPL